MNKNKHNLSIIISTYSIFSLLIILTAFISFQILFIDSFSIRLAAGEKPVSSRLLVNTLTPLGVDEKIAKDITIKLYKKLQDAKGKDRVIYREIDGISKSANRQLTGRVSKLGKNLIIIVKVVGGEQGKIIFTKTLIVKKDSDLDEMLDDVVEQITKNEEIW